MLVSTPAFLCAHADGWAHSCGKGWERSRGATGGEPLPPLASAASRRVGPCTRGVVCSWPSCTGRPGAASASVTLGRRADSERSGPPPASAAPVIIKYWICYGVLAYMEKERARRPL